ncbi:MAG: hypothetical protein OQJ89_12770, partial [Kangiellaceae bacterium]|nr:hypothetical protein [Kangiellaceae bacterium]
EGSAIDEPKMVYSSSYNAVFSCWLLCAAKALCNGDLSHYGKLIIEALDRNMWDAEGNSFIKQKEYQINSLPFYIHKDKISNYFPEDENRLLNAYVGSHSKEPQGYVNMHFKVLLKDAAIQAKMSIKQAQIIDESLRQKIQQINQGYYCEVQGEIADKEQQVLIFSCMTQALLWYPREINFSHYQSLKNKLREYVDSSNEVSAQFLVQLCYALAETMQLDNDKQLLAQVHERIESIEWDKDTERLTHLSKAQLYKLYCLLLEFGLVDKLPDKISELGLSRELEDFLIIRLDKNLRLNESTKQQFFEKYRVNQLLV